MTTGANVEGFEDDVTSWELYERKSGNTIMRGGQFKEEAVDEHEATCLPANDYVFRITNSNGNGFGDCESCGYFLFVDGVPLGGSTSFYDEDKFTFAAPVHEENASTLCSGDFFFSLYTDKNPEKIMWRLADDEGITVLYGKYDSVLYRLFCVSNLEHAHHLFPVMLFRRAISKGICYLQGVCMPAERGVCLHDIRHWGGER